MSSHHFVKEGQEPALLVVDAISFERAAPLLEWVPTVIVLEEALSDVLQWAIKIDVVVGRSSRLQVFEAALAEQAPVKLLLSDGLNNNSLSTALDFLQSSQPAGINILVHPTEPLFQFLEKYNRPGLALISENTKWCLCATSFQKWLPSNYKISIRKTLAQQSVQCRGLRDLEGHYETISEGFIQVDSADRFWVGEAS